MERAIPFDPEAMVGEPTSTLVMRTAGASHAYIVEPVIGVRISNLSNSEIAALLDEARSHRRRVTPRTLAASAPGGAGETDSPTRSSQPSRCRPPRKTRLDSLPRPESLRKRNH